MAFLLIDHCHPWTRTNLRVEFGFPDHHGVRVKVFNATFNNISAISWWTVLLVEETEDPERTTDLPQITNLTFNMLLFMYLMNIP
jgi:hypothetical protein